MKSKRMIAALVAGMCLIGGTGYGVSYNEYSPVTASAADVTADTSWYIDSADTYSISTVSQLAGFVKLCNERNTFEGKTILLAADFDFTNTVGLDSINTFSGTIDGKGHTISGVKRPFILTNNGTVKNISFAADINAKNLTVGVVASENRGNISDCNVSGKMTDNINSIPKYIGGICGTQNNGSIVNCISKLNISSETSLNDADIYVGGICGYSINSKISSCQNSGTITVNSNPPQSKQVVYTQKVVECNPVGKKLWYECYTKSSDVAATLSVGGVCGYAYNTEFTSCKNFGAIICKNLTNVEIPKINYYTDQKRTYTNEYGNTYYNLQVCYRYDKSKDIEGKRELNNNVGGICGYSYASKLYDCTNKVIGTVYTGKFGVICGYADDQTFIGSLAETTTTTTTEKSTTTTTTTTKKTTTTTKKATTTTTTVTKNTVTTSAATQVPVTTTTTTASQPALEVEKNELILAVGEQYTIKATQSGLTYKSNNTDVVVVSKSGVVTAIDVGETIVFVMNSDGDVSPIKVKVVASKTDVKYGDANLDGKVSVADAVAILQHLGNRDKYGLKPDGAVNADVDGSAGITGKDALVIQQVDAGMLKLEDLPLKSK